MAAYDETVSINEIALPVDGEMTADRYITEMDLIFCNIQCILL